MFIPAGAEHGTVNSGDEVLHLHAVFPSRKVRMEMLERNPAPGTEDDPPMTTIYDFATGDFESLGPTPVDDKGSASRSGIDRRLLPDLFHVTDAATWESAAALGVYDESTRGKNREEVGFIHASFAWQIERVANFVYADNTDPLVLLRIDPTALRSPVRVEGVDDQSEKFPHIYGSLTPEAVLEVLPLERRGGEYILPFPFP